MDLLFENITTDHFSLPNAKNISFAALRLDKIHPVISGNKWFKLQYYLDEARASGKQKILSFGGPWSNHIVATAAAAKAAGFSSAGIIRGEQPAILSQTLQQAKDYGMELYFIDRIEYRKKRMPPQLRDESAYVIPEGGYGEPGAAGAAKIFEYVKGDFTHCCCAVGTGTMMSGLINAAPAGMEIVGISAMKNNRQLEHDVSKLTTVNGNWQILHDYHFTGFGKWKPSLLLFMNALYRQTSIPTDFVYTGKLFYAITTLAREGFFPVNSRVLLIHSGGLQGNASLEKGTLIY